MYVGGLGVGPLFVGPLSEVYGRNIVYRVAFITFFALSWPVAFAPNIGTPPRYIICELANKISRFSGFLGIPIHNWVLRIHFPERRRWQCE